MAPVILRLQEDKSCELVVCLSGQHREMVGPILRFFGIAENIDFGLMTSNQSLAVTSSRIIAKTDEYIKEVKPDVVLVQGDTSTALCAAMAAYYNRVGVAHVEAGLRTWDKFSPYPEEFNRGAIARLADVHFAPTDWARENLVKEQISDEDIHVTGNTVIDALLMALHNLSSGKRAMPASLAPIFGSKNLVVLITGHRRENFGAGFVRICKAILTLARCHPDVNFVYPVHLNPNVRNVVGAQLGAVANIHLVEPLDYPDFVQLMQRSYLILTDSGGIQEEGPSLGKPVLVMRETTERPEGLKAGTVMLVGTQIENIVRACTRLLEDARAYADMAATKNPYGDGLASQRIAAVLKAHYP